MLILNMGDCTIKQLNETQFRIIDNYNKEFSKEVNILSDHKITCTCKKFSHLETCKHTRWIWNMRYAMDTNPNSLLHAQYSDLLTKNGLGKDSSKDFEIRKKSLDIITHENQQAIWGKYHSRDDGSFLIIMIKKEVKNAGSNISN